jgi:4-coumarate--CoA ligase
VVLSKAGKKMGENEVLKRLDEWTKERLSRYKWLTGGIEVVSEVRRPPSLYLPQRY